MVETVDNPPERIGKYIVLGVLGRGANGLVYKAQDPGIGRFVAIKTVNASGPGGVEARSQLVERLRSEARAAGNLRHPNIVTIFEVGEDFESPYIVMGYVEGETLGELVARKGALTPPEALKILWQVASALDYAHDHGVLHKDIKPANIVIDRGGQVMLLDFGIAALTTSLVEGPGAVALGTPAYMSPEQLLNKTVTHRSDLFSLAIVAFELFAGRRPFPGDSFQTVVGSILNGRKLPLGELNPALPLALEAEFETALSTKEEARFGSAQAMVDAFSKALGVDVVVRSSAVMMPTVEPREFEPEKRRDSKALVPRVSGGARGGVSPARSQRDLFGDGEVSPFGYRARDGLSMGGIVLIFIFTALFGLGVALLVADPGYFSELFKGPQKTDIAPRPADFAADEELLAPLSDPAPADRATAEFTDRQLMGMILNERAPEALVKEAIDEAERRKLAGLAAALVKPLRHDGYLVRIRALEVLSTLGDKRVVPAVMGALDDHDPLVRGYAARALGTIGDKRAVPYLSARLGSETVEEVKESLRRAIDKLNGFSVKGD